MRNNNLLMIVAGFMFATTGAQLMYAQESDMCRAHEDNDKVTLIDGYINGHPYVDLGLPSGTLWAVYNVGAENETESGDYFAWGETEPYDPSKPNPYYVEQARSSEQGRPGGCISGTQYDVATERWGDGWAMPDSVQVAELKACTFAMCVKENGIEGVRICSERSEGKSIFLGYFGINEFNPDPWPLGGYYWSGSEACGGLSCEDALAIGCPVYSLIIDWNVPVDKLFGLPVRPVFKKKSGIENISAPKEQLQFSILSGTVRFSRPVRKGTLELSDLSGRQVFLTGINNNETACLPSLTPGAYIIRIKEADNVVISKKIIIKL